MKSTNCCVKKEFHEKMRDLKEKFSLDPILLIITTFPKFMLELHEDMNCMIGKNIEKYIYVQ